MNKERVEADGSNHSDGKDEAVEQTIKKKKTVKSTAYTGCSKYEIGMWLRK